MYKKNEGKYKSLYIFFLVFIILLPNLILVCGCNNGSGSSSNNYSPISAIIYDPDSSANLANQLAQVGNIVNLSLKPGKENFVLLPANNKYEKYGVTITTLNSRPNRTVKVNLKLPFASIYEIYTQIEKNLNQAHTTFRNDSIYLLLNKIYLESELRKRLKGKPTVYSKNYNIRGNISAISNSPTYADNSDETLNSIKEFWIYSRSVFGIGQQEYTKRRGKLVRIGKHIKIFIDIDQYDGLSAIEGNYKVTDGDLNEILSELDNYGVKLIYDKYGKAWDIDNDGKISIFISPLLTKNGFAGFFDTKHYEITDSTGNVNQYCNKRDMISVWAPGFSAEWVGKKWLSATIETCIHELQHMVSYSTRAQKYGYPMFLSEDNLEETWLDECMSVAAEARYRILRNLNPSEDRFEIYSKSTTYNWSLLSFTWALEAYGHIGLFGLYLWEQGGDDVIKQIINANTRGKDTIDSIFSDRNGLDGLYIDFGIALLIEGLLSKGVISPSFLDKLSEKHKFINRLHLPLNINYFNKLNSSKDISPNISSYATFYGYVYVPKSYNDSVLPFQINSYDNIVISFIRLE